MDKVERPEPYEKIKLDVVDTKDKVLTYPEVPNPVTVDVILAIEIPPGPNAVEKDEMAALILEFMDRVETYPEVPNPVTVENKLEGFKRLP